MSQFKINSITDKSGTSGPVIAGVSTNNSTGCMIIPAGPTENRGGRGRGVLLGGGNTPVTTKASEFLEIATLGSAQSFGDLSQTLGTAGGCASATRSFSLGGDTSPSGGSNTAKIEYVVTSSAGGGNDFGDLTLARRYPGGVSDSTRGLANGGTSPTPGVNTDLIDYITMASTGDATGFGSLLEQATYFTGSGCQSPTRGFLGGGQPSLTRNIQSYNIQSQGDATKFGELTVGRSGITAGSNSTRGIFAGGVTPSYTNTIEFITMSTEGNGTDFGDLIGQVAYTGAGMYSATRGVHAGGYPSTNAIQYITIATTGDAQDFGDLILKRVSYAGSSDSHGGLG